MNLPITVTQEDLLEILLNVAPSRPVFIWGAPGIGKSALVEQFAQELDLPCVSLLGSQLAPEDIIGIPQINGETSEFLPPKEQKIFLYPVQYSLLQTDTLRKI